MSIQSEINRISGNVANALTAIANKGVTVPSGSNSDDLATLIGQIQTGGGGAGAISIVDTPDSAGGTVRTITAVDISGDTVTAAHLEQGYTAHDAQGNAITGTLEPGGGGGLEYETGTWTPASDVSSQLLYFQNTHSQCPIIDVTGNTPASNSILAQAVIDWSKFAEEPIFSTDSTSYYGREQHYYYNGSSATAGGTGISYPSSNPGDSTSSYARFWATETYFHANINSNSRYWRSGRTYKWIAVWAPTS